MKGEREELYGRRKDSNSRRQPKQATAAARGLFRPRAREPSKTGEDQGLGNGQSSSNGPQQRERCKRAVLRLQKRRDRHGMAGRTSVAIQWRQVDSPAKPIGMRFQLDAASTASRTRDEGRDVPEKRLSLRAGETQAREGPKGRAHYCQVRALTGGRRAQGDRGCFLLTHK